MIHSGLDWSGTPGRTQGDWIVFAVVHIDQANVPLLEQQLLAAKNRLNVKRPDDFIFKHDGATPEILQQALLAFARSPITAHVHRFNKVMWGQAQSGSQKPTGGQALLHGIVTLVSGCPDSVVNGQKLFIDLPAEHKRQLEDYRTGIRKALQNCHPPRSGFAGIRPCPDHKIHGGVIQMADLLAGEVRKLGGLTGPTLTSLSSKVTLV